MPKKDFKMEIHPESEFKKEIEKESGQNVNLCYQCMKCTAGCPMADEMDCSPTQIVHAIRLGLKDKVLKSKTIWVCASCETCTTRCPQDVDIAKLMDAARHMAFKEALKVSDEVSVIPLFYRIALKNIRSFGRMYEMGMIASLKFATKEFFKDLKLGYKMGLKGKLKLLPEMTRNQKEVKKIFDRALEIEGKKL